MTSSPVSASAAAAAAAVHSSRSLSATAAATTTAAATNSNNNTIAAPAAVKTPTPQAINSLNSNSTMNWARHSSEALGHAPVWRTTAIVKPSASPTPSPTYDGVKCSKDTDCQLQGLSVLYGCSAQYSMTCREKTLICPNKCSARVSFQGKLRLGVPTN